MPPRKRIRVSYEDEDDDEEQEQFLLDAPRSSRPEIPQSVRIIDRYDDDDGDLQDYEEYRDDSSSMSEASPHRRNHVEDHSQESEMDDYTDEEDDGGDLETELRLLREEAEAEANNVQEEDSNSPEYEEEDIETEDQDAAFDANLIFNSMREASNPYSVIPGTSITSTAVQDYTNVPMEILITVVQTAFPELSADIRSTLTRTNKSLRKAYLSLTLLCEPCLTFDQMMDDSSFLLAPFTRRDGSGSVPKQTEEVELSPLDILKGGVRKPLIEEVEEADGSEESITNGVPISPQKSKQSRHMNTDDTSDSDFDDSESEESGLDSESDSESDSGNDSLDNDSSSEEENGQISDQPVAAAFANEKSSDISSDESSSDDDSDSSSNVDAGDSVQHGHNLRVESLSISSDASSSESSDSGSDSESDSESESESEMEEISSKRPVLSAAQQHNTTTAFPLQIQTSGKPQAVGLTRTQKRNARRKRNKTLKELHPEQSELANGTEGDAVSEEFLARKKALLAAILDETHEGNNANDAAEMGDVPPLAVVVEEESREAETNASNADEVDTSDLKDGPAKRHARIDMGAGRRLVFGALGLKTPANKADEQKIRDSLIKDVRPLVNPRTMQGNGGNDANEAPSDDNEDEDADAWREKIIYKAVECCHENMTLCEPPFPFVQRWDPQQKYDAMRKRKRASENYQADTSYEDSTYYYDDEPEEDHYAGESRKKTKKKKGKSVSLQNGSLNQDEQDVVLNYDEAPVKSSQFTDVDDLPSLPKDVKALPLLEPGSAQPGMVITWNQLVMSKATKWQPEMLPITGLIVPGGENGDVHVILARRDREDNEKIYDEVTGERVYGKFEVPDLDEVGEEEDTGFRSLQWTEMIEPRLLQQAPTGGMAQTSVSAKAAIAEDEVPPGHDKVSESQSEEDDLESEFSTGQVRAAVEDDLMHDHLGTQVNLESMSIQSGQRLPRLDLSMSEVQISTASNSFEHLGQLNSNNPPKAVNARSEHVLTVAANPQNAHSPKLTRWTEREDETAADQEAELGPSLADAMAEEVSNFNTLTSKRTEPSEEEGEEEGREWTHGDSGASMANHSNTIIASSQFTVPSGRQPRTSYSIEDALHNDTIIPETLPQLRETTSIQSQAKSQTTPSSPASSSPFPSLEQIFMSAQPTQSSGRRRETPSLPATQSLPARDVEYEEAMRKLDEGHESDLPPEKKEQEEEVMMESKLFPNATQPSSRTRLLDEGLLARQISLSQSEKRKEDQSLFVIPAGSQVIILSSSPASSSGVLDENNGSEYERGSLAQKRGSLPTGPGWVRKNTQHERDLSGNKKRDAVTASSRSGRRRRPDKETLSMAPLVSAVSKYKGRRKRENGTGSSTMWR